jgi:hypothetical protein
MISLKGAHFVKDIILTCVRWYLAYPLSYRQVEELMDEPGISVDHAMIQRWVLKYSSQLEEAFHRRTRPIWRSWRMDETYIEVKASGAVSAMAGYEKSASQRQWKRLRRPFFLMTNVQYTCTAKRLGQMKMPQPLLMARSCGQFR